MILFARSRIMSHSKIKTLPMKFLPSRANNYQSKFKGGVGQEDIYLRKQDELMNKTSGSRK